MFIDDWPSKGKEGRGLDKGADKGGWNRGNGKWI